MANQYAAQLYKLIEHIKKKEKVEEILSSYKPIIYIQIIKKFKVFDIICN